MLPALPLVLLPPTPSSSSPSSPGLSSAATACLRDPLDPGYGGGGGAVRLAGARGGGAHAGVLVCVGGDVGDELLGREGEEAG